MLREMKTVLLCKIEILEIIQGACENPQIQYKRFHQSIKTHRIRDEDDNKEIKISIKKKAITVEKLV